MFLSPRPTRYKNDFLFFARLALLLLACICIAALATRAEHTRRWRQSTYDELLKGTAHGVAVRSDGRLELAPKFASLADADASYLWSLRVNPQGVLFAGGGSPAKVFRFDASGKPTTVFDSTDLSAQAIAFDAKGTLYVGTSPDGKVYRVNSSGEKSVFFDPKTKYIWDLAFGPNGTLYVATGDKGQIFAVSPEGKGDVFYSTDEAHIRVLAFDAKGNLIAGTEPSGRILRITRGETKSERKEEKAAASTAEGFVLYETSKREVTSIAVAPDGTIYAAAIGEKPRGVSGQAPSVVITSSQGTTTISGGGPIGGSQVAAPTPFAPFPPLLSSSIYRISPSGAPEELWSSREDLVYTLGFGPDGRVLVGTGNNGALLVIDGRGVYAQLAKAGSSQITGITKNNAGKVFLCTSNPGKIFSVGPEYEAEGTYESHSFDAQLFSQWGGIEWWGPVPEGQNAAKAAAGPRTEFFVRSGNTEDPGKEWSRWFGPYSKSGSNIEAPPARFVQWKAVIHDGRPGDGIDWVSLAYLPHNVAPVIDSVVLQDPGVRVQSPPVLTTSSQQPVILKLPPAPGPAGIIIAPSPTPRFDSPPQGFAQKGFQSVLWSAHDENDDDLRYSVYYRGENEKEWKPLKDNLEQKFYSWDTTTMPDGAYYLKITATDAPSNPPAVALTAERESERFEIVNTPPVIESLLITSASGKTSGRYIASFTAKDPATSIERVQYSLDGGEWVLLAPTDGIIDGSIQKFSFSVGSLSSGEHTITVRAFDKFDNVGSAKTTTIVPAAKP